MLREMFIIIKAMLILTVFFKCCIGQDFLTVNRTNMTLHGEKVFLSGVNQAWYNYGADFGHENYAISKPHLIHTLDAIETSGGNSIRIWVHTSGFSTPEFNSTGYVTGLDSNIIRDMTDFVLEAEKRNILVTFTLWNCAAINKNDNVYGLLSDVNKLRSYVSNALVPMVRALKPLRALGMWEIINEPEGCVMPGIRNTLEPCYDTSTLHFWDFSDWSGLNLPLQLMLQFVATQSQAIHTEDAKALVTVGSWTYKSVTNQLDRRNLFSDACLMRAGGGLVGSHLDLYQIHTYASFIVYLPHDPFMVNASVYVFDKPVIIGEFSQRKGGLMKSEQQFTWAYYHGYSGAWSWCATGKAKDTAADTLEVQERGMRTLKNKNNQSAGGRVNIIIQKQQGQGRLYDIAAYLINYIFSFPLSLIMP